MNTRKMLHATLLCATLGLVSVSWSQNPLASIFATKQQEADALKLLEEKAFSHSDNADRSRCAAAIEALTWTKPTTSEPVLIHYFDFLATNSNAVGVSSRAHIMPYPAVEIFISHGSASLPLLRTTVQSDESSQLVRENASVAIGWILQLDFPKLAGYLQ